MMTEQKQQIIWNVSPAMPFEAVTEWASNHSTYVYTFVPQYTNKKTQKQYEKWLKNRVSN